MKRKKILKRLATLEAGLFPDGLSDEAVWAMRDKPTDPAHGLRESIPEPADTPPQKPGNAVRPRSSVENATAAIAQPSSSQVPHFDRVVFSQSYGGTRPLLYPRIG